MKVYEIQGEFGYDNLKIAERPDPEPGPGKVVVKVSATSLNYRDHLMITGAYNPRQPLPLVPVSDGVGRVEAIGDGVRGLEVGDRVCGIFAQAWLGGKPTAERIRSTLGGPLDGMLAEKVCLNASGVIAVPEHLTDEQAATLPCAGVTAWNGLVKYDPVTAGQRVLLLGTGGVSIYGLQLAKALGAEVFITSSSDEKLERARELGADHTINYRSDENWGKTVRKLTGGVGVDCILEVGGAGTLANSLRAITPGGQIVLIGVLQGDAKTPNLTSAFMNSVRLQGLFVGNRDDFESLNRAVVTHRIEPVVDQVFPFTEAPAAFNHFAAGKHFGKVVIRH